MVACWNRWLREGYSFVESFEFSVESFLMAERLLSGSTWMSSEPLSASTGHRVAAALAGPAVQNVGGLVVGGRHAGQVDVVGVEYLVAGHALQIDTQLEPFVGEVVAQRE